MCRLLGYLGPPVPLDRLLIKPEHSLVVQSYSPREMTAGLLNADGFGLGWYGEPGDALPCRYRSTQPIWSDNNLPDLARAITSGCILANVRSATVGLPVDMSNCQPFRFEGILGMHNGFIDDFRRTLYRRLRDALDDDLYREVEGVTDSEHLFGYILSLWRTEGGSLEAALSRAFITLRDWLSEAGVDGAFNLLFSNGQRLVAARYATRTPVPTLYWLRDDPLFPASVLIASEPLFASTGWIAFPEHSIVTVEADLEVKVIQL